MIDLGLGRITRLVKDYGSKISWKAVHIAGTNGKGTVAAYLSSIFHQKGIRVGRFTSPHLIDRWDCITLNQIPVSKQQFLDIEKEIKERDHQYGIKATEFELLTTTAFELFHRERMQVAIIECGLGGLRDATNILTKDEVICSVITKIGLDHQNLLGNTIEEIAVEKAGIVKPNIPVVVDESNLENVKITIERVAKVNSSQLVYSALPNFADKLDLRAHQKQNLATALTAFNVAQSRWEPLFSVSALSYKDVKELSDNMPQIWQGRLQPLSIESISCRQAPVLLDGAHNAQSADALCDYVTARLRKNGSVTWVLAMSAGKNTDDILSRILHQGDNVISCEFGPVDGMPWVKPQSSRDLAASASTFGANVSSTDRIGNAVNMATEVADEEDPIVIAGSLYLVSDTLRLVRDSMPKA